jgi:hypothetical protein
LLRRCRDDFNLPKRHVGERCHRSGDDIRREPEYRMILSAGYGTHRRLGKL